MLDKCVVGFDIGKAGGYVINSNGRVPTARVVKYDMDGFVRDMVYYKPDAVYAENVHAMPGQGLVSTGSLMQQKGELIGVCKALGIRLELIEPIRWMECFTIKRTKHFKSSNEWKKHLVSIALGLATMPVSGFINISTADAFLIWYYASAIEEGRPLKSKGTLIL